MPYALHVRLTERSDPDLLALYGLWGRSFPAAVRKALRAYVRGEPLIIEVPDGIRDPGDGDRRLYIKFSESRDGDVADFLRGIRDGQRGNAVKSIFRRYLSDGFVAAFFEDPGSFALPERGTEGVKAYPAAPGKPARPAASERPASRPGNADHARPDTPRGPNAGISAQTTKDTEPDGGEDIFSFLDAL